MTTLLEKISDLNDMILQGNALEAFEKYYSDDVVMQEIMNPRLLEKVQTEKKSKIFLHLL
jgi:hypothetical protein